MRETVLYIAMSLDGYIADIDGNIDWLTSFDSQESSYPDFLASVDTIVMGHTTYMQLTTILSPDVWPYLDKEVYVATRQNKPSDGRVKFTSHPEKLVSDLKSKTGKRIWIVGGAQLAQNLSAAGLIDMLILTIVPLTLGRGIPLFSETANDFRLVEARKLGPFAQLIYQTDSVGPKS